jgi:hypothetical protein
MPRVPGRRRGPDEGAPPEEQATAGPTPSDPTTDQPARGDARPSTDSGAGDETAQTDPAAGLASDAEQGPGEAGGVGSGSGAGAARDARAGATEPATTEMAAAGGGGIADASAVAGDDEAVTSRGAGAATVGNVATTDGAGAATAGGPATSDGGDGTTTDSADAAEAPEMAPADARPRFRERTRMRRRLRYLRRIRELAFRDLGGLVFDLHRFRRERGDLVQGKLQALAEIDRELRTLENALRDHREYTDLREAGIAACPRCGTIHDTGANFCPGCGTALRRSVVRDASPVSVAPADGEANAGDAPAEQQQPSTTAS